VRAYYDNPVAPRRQLSSGPLGSREHTLTITMKDPKELNAHHFSLQLSTPDEWIKMADSLLHVAQLIEPELKERWDLHNTVIESRKRPLPSLGIQNVYLLLIAYSVENLLKSVIIRSNISKYRNASAKQKALPEILRNHRLFSLAKLAGFKMTWREELTLRRLSRFSIWAGRYPIPTKAQDLEANEALSNGEVWTVGYLSSADVTEVTNLLVNLFKQLHIDPPSPAA
jgi:hypothetical protein